MKASKYNTIINVDEKTLLFNSLSRAFAIIDDETLDLLNNITSYSKFNKEQYNNLIKNGFIINEFVNEEKIIEYRYQSFRFNTDRLSLVIAPTMNCNCHCIYCYEKDENRSDTMSAECVENIKKFIKFNLKTKKSKSLHITWFGGEPLMGLDIIDQLSKDIIDFCQNNNINYTASIITNGILLDEVIVKKLMEEYNIRTFQITLDGAEESHNTRRILKNGNNTFNTIIAHIKLLLLANARVSIRINVDNTNIEGIDQLVELFNKDVAFKKANIYFGKLTDSSATCTCDFMSDEEFSLKTFEALDYLEKNGYNEKIESYVPMIRYNNCSADKKNAFVIDAMGNLYKCWHSICDVSQSFGNINSQNIIPYEYNENYLKWMTYSPTENKNCKDCKILPMCLGGCLMSSLNDDLECVQWKFNLDLVLKKIYWKNKEKNDGNNFRTNL